MCIKKKNLGRRKLVSSFVVGLYANPPKQTILTYYPAKFLQKLFQVKELLRRLVQTGVKWYWVTVNSKR